MVQSSMFKSFSEPLRLAVESSGMDSPTPPQVLAWPHVIAGEDVLLVAPTGTGKTEAALLPVLDRVIKDGAGDGISILYITPMRALNRDMMKRLEFWGTRLNLDIQVRHGDTSVQVRRKQSLKPPDILITTPETLQSILPGRRMRNHLKSVKVVVVDEVHGLVESKRGVQLLVGLQRLSKLADFQLVGLSATVGDVEETGRFLFSTQPYKLLKVDMSKKVRYSVDYPVPSEADNLLSREIFATSELAARLSAINDLLDTHESALIFVNSRTVAEMLGEKLGRIRRDVAVHHGSLPRDERERVEYAFKEGRLKALVCTSTLELGIDIGSVDLVIQYMSPRQVTSMIQRVGRSGHRVGRTSEGVLITVSTDDILESGAVIREAYDNRLEKTRPFVNSLDVLAHQIVGYLMDFESVKEEDLLEDLKKTHPYRGLKPEVLKRVVEYLLGLRKLGVRGNTLTRNRASREYYYDNLSMIPDETRYTVIDVTSDQKVGILGEEFMLLKARIGLHFICKGKVWQIEKIADDHKVFVTPSDDPLAAVPAWDGEMLPIPYQLARRVGYLRRTISQALDAEPTEELVQDIRSELPVPIQARQKVVKEIKEHKQMNAPVPSDQLVLLEGFQKYLIIHTCFGEGVNRAIALVSEEILSRKGLIRLWWIDAYRILIELTVDSSELDLDSLCSQLLHLSLEE
ncbi:MAG: DEAD/DEAH box helicase, partial [Nitrososphaerales archaeon]